MSASPTANDRQGKPPGLIPKPAPPRPPRPYPFPKEQEAPLSLSQESGEKKEGGDVEEEKKN